MDKQKLAPSPTPQPWTSIDAYRPDELQRRLQSRRMRPPGPRTQPEMPSAVLSTLPFLALLGVLAMLFLVIATLAWPQAQPSEAKAAPAQAARGTAPKGWFQAAEKEFAAQAPAPVKAAR